MSISYLKPEEYDEFMRFLEKCYRHTRDYFPRRYPHVWCKDTVDYENRLILKVDGKIVSHVGIFPLKLIVEDCTIPVGGIGGVATLQEYRGRGYMTKLMNAAIEKMKKDGYPLSVLWGDRQRYGHFGYENAGKLAYITVSLRSLKIEAKVEKIDYSRLDVDYSKLNVIKQLHEKEPLRLERNDEFYERVFKMPGLMTYIAEDNSAYVVHFGERCGDIVEYGGSPESLLNLLYSLLIDLSKEFGVSSTDVAAPYYPYATFHELLKVSTGMKIGYEAMAKILDLKKLLEAYRPLLEKRCEEIEVEATIKVKETNEVVHLELSKGSVSIEGREKEPTIVLSERDVVKLLFNGVYEVPAKVPTALASVLPLPMHFTSLDHI